MSSKESFTTSSLSLNLNEDWDRSSDIIIPQTQVPRSSVLFPGEEMQNNCSTPGANGSRKDRSLSELMRLHAEKGTNVTFNVEEASRVADVLKQWVSHEAPSPPPDDDFFSRANNDLSLGAKHRETSVVEREGRAKVSSRDSLRRDQFQFQFPMSIWSFITL
ncbi:hypothetical protein EV424DRAFT_1314832 [Suillus variegatus]|nr:hypothetical protein EV424DRAFT_1314832 [Suillus variegatus]